MGRGRKPRKQSAGWKLRLQEYVRGRGGRMTRQRDQVAEVFFSLGGHPGVEQVVNEVRKQHPRIGPATVYRTMKLLCDAGLVGMREFGEGFARYEALAPQEHHDHLLCTGCGRIIEFGEEAIEALQQQVTRRYGFEMHHHRLDIYGLCRECVRARDSARARTREPPPSGSKTGSASTPPECPDSDTG